MPITCCVFGCSNRQEKGVKRHFFSFPWKDKKMFDLWIKCLQREHWKPTKWSKVCSDHFKSDDFLDRIGSYVTHLKSNACPSIFPQYPLYLQRIEQASNLSVEQEPLSQPQAPVYILPNDTVQYDGIHCEHSYTIKSDSNLDITSTSVQNISEAQDESVQQSPTLKLVPITSTFQQSLNTNQKIFIATGPALRRLNMGVQLVSTPESSLGPQDDPLKLDVKTNVKCELDVPSTLSDNVLLRFEDTENSDTSIFKSQEAHLEDTIPTIDSILSNRKVNSGNIPTSDDYTAIKSNGVSKSHQPVLLDIVPMDVEIQTEVSVESAECNLELDEPPPSEKSGHNSDKSSSDETDSEDSELEDLPKTEVRVVEPLKKIRYVGDCSSDFSDPVVAAVKFDIAKRKVMEQRKKIKLLSTKNRRLLIRLHKAQHRIKELEALVPKKTPDKKKPKYRSITVVISKKQDCNENDN